MPTIDLQKTYGRVNWKIWINNCEKKLTKNICSMLQDFTKPMDDSSKGDIIRKETRLRIGITQREYHSPILFLIQVQDI